MIMNAHWIDVMVHRFFLMNRRIMLLGIGMAFCLAVSGCGQQAGVLMYHMGLVKPEKIPAECELPKKPLLILVDDDWDLVHPRTACNELVDALAKQLKAHELIERVTTNEELAKLRQATPDFDRHAADEVGRMANADTVLWLQVVRFTMEDDLELAVSQTHFAVTVKLLNARAEKRDDVRIWPKGREGKLVEVKVSPHDIRRCKNIPEAHTLVAQKLADEIAKLFYEYTEEQ